MTTSTNDPTSGLFVGIASAAISAKVSWLVPAGSPTRAITMEQTPQAFSALQLRLLSTGHQARSILIVMEATGSRLHQPRYHPDAGRLALDGLWFAEMFGLAPPNPGLRAQVEAFLLALIQESGGGPCV